MAALMTALYGKVQRHITALCEGKETYDCTMGRHRDVWLHYVRVQRRMAALWEGTETYGCPI